MKNLSNFDEKSQSFGKLRLAGMQTSLLAAPWVAATSIPLPDCQGSKKCGRAGYTPAFDSSSDSD